MKSNSMGYEGECRLNAVVWYGHNYGMIDVMNFKRYHPPLKNF